MGSKGKNSINAHLPDYQTPDVVFSKQAHQIGMRKPLRVSGGPLPMPMRYFPQMWLCELLKNFTWPSTVSWKHLPTCPFCLLRGLWGLILPPLPFPLLRPWSLPWPLAGWERCCTECEDPSLLWFRTPWPGLTRATWCTCTSASGGCWMCTFTMDTCREAVTNTQTHTQRERETARDTEKGREGEKRWRKNQLAVGWLMGTREVCVSLLHSKNSKSLDKVFKFWMTRTLDWPNIRSIWAKLHLTSVCFCSQQASSQ